MTVAIEELLENAKDVTGSKNLPLLKRVYEFAEHAHEGQKRRSGEPFIVHPLEVAKIVSQLKMDAPTIAAALLHDVVEDSSTSLEEIEAQFGSEIAFLVDGVTKLSKISEKPDISPSASRLFREKEHFENLRRIFVAMAKDIRVIIIKLADRLHNLKTLCNLSKDRQRFIARETLEIYGPLAHRLGIWQLKSEMEDLAFSYLEPEKRQFLEKEVAQLWMERESDIHLVIETLSKRLEQAGIQARIEGRPKHYYSIWQKMINKGKSLGEIHDLAAVRVMVNTLEDCYATLGIVHGLWMPLDDRIKDYISKPKSNHYQSLHTTIYAPGGKPLEVQIRTLEMHRIAEFGVAAHWHYKQVSKDKSFEKMMAPWMDQLKEWQHDLKSAKEYVEAFKMDFLEKQVFVFTPKGDVIDLPQGSGPIDFAYRVHTDVGHQCVGAKVNGRMISLDYILQNGDIVEVMTSKTSSGPSWDWLNICKTSNAKQKIRAWFKKEHLPPAKSKETTAPLEKVPPVLIKPHKKIPTSVQAVLVSGVDRPLIRLSKCCNPLPGDKIKGYITLGKGISVHQEGCPNFKALLRDGSGERFISVSWNTEVAEQVHLANLEIRAWSSPKILAQVLERVSAEDLVTRSCNSTSKQEQTLIRLGIEVPNLHKLDQLIRKIREISEVIQIHRKG